MHQMPRLMDLSEKMKPSEARSVNNGCLLSFTWSSVAQWSRLLNATVPDGLMALAGLGSNPGLEGGFSARLD